MPLCSPEPEKIPYGERVPIGPFLVESHQLVVAGFGHVWAWDMLWEYEQDYLILGLKSIDTNQIESRKPWFEERWFFSKKYSIWSEEEIFSKIIPNLKIKLYKQQEREILQPQTQYIILFKPRNSPEYTTKWLGYLYALMSLS